MEDPRAAAAALSRLPREAATSSWCPRQRARRAAVLERRGDDVLVEEPFGLRVTRIPAQPSLGRRARERRIATLRQEATTCAESLELALARLRGVEGAERDADEVLTAWSALAAGDPSEAIERAEARADELTRDEATHRARARDARERAATLRERAGGLRRLLEDAYL